MATPNPPEEAAPPASSPTPMSPEGDSDEIKPSSSDESLVQELPASHVARLTRRSMEQIEEVCKGVHRSTKSLGDDLASGGPGSWAIAAMPLRRDRWLAVLIMFPLLLHCSA